MVRDFLDRFEEQSPYFPHRIKTRLNLTLVSGMLASPVIDQWIVPRLNEIENLTAEVKTINNVFYGDSVTVTGLLTGQDIYHQLREQIAGDIILLPANCINFEGVFLDDWTPAMLQARLKKTIEFIDTDFVSFIEKLK